jgi:spermidine synthase/Tfp pilus assembly protein PilF/MFS family permease
LKETAHPRVAIDSSAETCVLRSRGSSSAWLAANGTVFLASACVMVVELVAGRIISRHLGSSIYTWTSVIGVILGGLAVGNYVGGRLADRYAPRATLSVLFVLSSVTCVAITVANNLVGEWTVLWDLAWPARVATHVALVFGLPAALMGTIGPVVARMALGMGRRTGRTLGSVYAWGVLGSLVGTFATGYVLIDVIGTGAIIWSVAGILALIGVLYMPLSLKGWGWAGVLVVACLASNASWGWARSLGERLALREVADPSVIYRDESLYSHIEVRQVSSDPDVRALYLDKLLHSQVSMDDPLNVHYGYIRLFSELTRVRAADKRTIDTVTIGGGGYVFPRYLEQTWPGSRVDVVEIDPAVTAAAKAAFGLPEDTRIRTIHSDGRVFVNRLAERRGRGEAVPTYDFVYLDAVNDFSVPYQLTTVEFFEKVGELLTSDGMLLINSIDLLDSGRFVGSLVGTLAEVFPYVGIYTVAGHERMRGDSRLTFVVAASRSAWSWDGSEGVVRMEESAVEAFRQRAGGLVLSDSFAPVENLLAPVVRASSQEVAANEALARAIELDRRGDQVGYIRFCREALRRDPGFAEAHYYLGVGLYRMGSAAEAMTHWEQALRSRPDYVEVHYSLGAAHYGLGDLDRAWRHLSAARRLRPEMAEAHNAAGIVLEARGDLTGAMRLYERALGLDPQLVEAREHLERVRIRARLTDRTEETPS